MSEGRGKRLFDTVEKVFDSGYGLVWNDYTVQKVINPGVGLWNRVEAWAKGKGFLPEGWERQDTDDREVRIVDHQGGVVYEIGNHVPEKGWYDLTPVPDLGQSDTVSRSFVNPFTGLYFDFVPLSPGWEVKLANDHGRLIFWNRNTGETSKKDPRQRPEIPKARSSRWHEGFGKKDAYQGLIIDETESNDLPAYVISEEAQASMFRDDKPREILFDDVYDPDREEGAALGSTPEMAVTLANILRRDNGASPSFAEIYETAETHTAPFNLPGSSPEAPNARNPFKQLYSSAENTPLPSARSEIAITPATLRGGKPRRRARAYLSDL
ncbi:hypothetical protein CALCODRAFT_519631 [Calocera cornea HHB12733]|uniref:WW domain-containing protein n=1 Tax=Calocera cornea HHB12733 TaxID=1353952 RepID=A0A165E469_9BASI|nr:hypothetical protein CALCODRAFT_519631 [Calocera cornea HHB12733]